MNQLTYLYCMAVTFQKMSDSGLQEFCRILKPPAKYTETCQRVSRELFDLLLSYSRYPITDYIIGGGLPIAKNTSTCLKADSDCTIYVDWSKLKVIPIFAFSQLTTILTRSPVISPTTSSSTRKGS